MKRLAINLIKAYQLFFSDKRVLRCKYHPSCSEYAMLAIEKHGTLFGVARGAWRIIRCNPLSRGGLDLP